MLIKTYPSNEFYTVTLKTIRLKAMDFESVKILARMGQPSVVVSISKIAQPFSRTLASPSSGALPI